MRRDSVPLRLLAIDPGSARMGCVVGDAGAERWTEERPGRLRIVAVAQVLVDPHDHPRAVAEAFELAQARGVVGVVIERGALYMPAGVTPQAARQIAVHHAQMSRLADLCADMAGALGMPVRTVARATWVHSVIRKHQGGITDAMILAALPRHLAPECVTKLRTKDLRDAAGALLWSLLPPSALSRLRGIGGKRRAPYKPAPAAWHGWEARQMWQRARLRMLDNLERAGAEAAARLSAPCPCGPHGRGRRPASCPRAMTVVGAYACAKCGGPRKGHIKGLPCPVVRAEAG